MAVLVAAVAASLTLPKLLLADYFSRAWIRLGPAGLVGVALQDAALAAVVMHLLWRRVAPGAGAGLRLPALLSTALLVLLTLDARVRELWLGPIDLHLVAYAWANRGDLTSGTQLFFGSPAGWGMTFRRAMTLIVGLHLLLWSLLAFALRRSRPAGPPAGSRSRAWSLATGVLLPVALVAGSARAERRYRLRENPLVASVVRLATPGSASAPCGVPPSFEQPPRAFADTLRTPRRILSSARPFRSLLVVFLESVRWRDLGLDGGASPYPTLRRLAAEGLLARAWVPVPHSSKAYFTVLTGRYPYPGVEMRESRQLRHESFVHALRSRVGARTSAFTSMHLAFEGTGLMLAAMGFDRRAQVDELARGEHVQLRRLSSFGGLDAPLYAMAVRELAASPEPFVCLLLPLAAHYPYARSDRAGSGDGSHAAYLASLAEADRNLEALLDGLAAHGLDRDALVVLVGDHGESFGEHGTFAHNNSLHEEEVAVPIVFWSRDGRLRHPEVLRARQVDVAPTVLDLFGLHGDATPVQGESLLRADGRSAAFLASFFDDVALGVVDPPLKHLYEPASGRLVRFDLAADPLEARPIPVVGPERDAIVERLLSFQSSSRAAHCPR